MKRNRTGEDELNPSRNNRSVWSVRQARQGRDGGWGRGWGGCAGRGDHGHPKPDIWPVAQRLETVCIVGPTPSQPTSPFTGRNTSSPDQVKGGTACGSGPWAWATPPGAKSWLHVL